MDYVYLLKNKVTKRVYVGRTCCPEKRFQQHISALRSKRHNNDLMQKDFDEYGENSFDKLALYFDQKVTNDMGALAQARQEQERWKALLDSAEKGSEAWDKYYENYKNATNNLNSLLESSIQDAMVVAFNKSNINKFRSIHS